MTLTADFNSSAQAKRRMSVVETDTFGAHSPSRYICGLAVRRSAQEQRPVIVRTLVIQAAPVVIRRGMNI
jgi:hypothetical protein